MSDIADFFQTIRLPVMSEVAHELIASLENDDVTTAEIRDLLARDPALTAKVVRLANSATFGMQREISSLDHAILVVGTMQVRTLALTASMNVAFPDIPQLDRIEFWRYCLNCAGYAQWLAEGVRLETQAAWLGGMMLRLGELLIGQQAPSLLDEIELEPHIPGERWARERRLLGFDEGQITAELARRWNFPDAIVQALASAGTPLLSPPLQPLAGVLHLAGWLADMPFAEPVVIDALPSEVIQALDLDVDWMRSQMPEPHSFFDVSSL